MKARCYDKDFKYVPAAHSDIRITIRREKKRLADEAAKRPTTTANVRQIAAKKAK